MEFWIVLWKVLIIAGFTICGLVTVWVTIAGWFDIKHLLNNIKESHTIESEGEKNTD
ncbi:MAG: hypothetical protein KAU83_08070 [Bacteroidales bacterium]|nr:hypothetical protein [Bacteroidales bacterium]